MATGAVTPHTVRATVRTSRAAIFIGVSAGIVAIVAIIIAPLLAERSAQDDRDKLDDEIRPFQLAVDALRLDVAVLAAGSRSLPADAAGLPGRYQVYRDSFPTDLARFLELGEQAGYGSSAATVATNAEELVAALDQLVSLSATASADQAQAFFSDEVAPRLDVANQQFASLDSLLLADVDAAQGRISDIERISWIVVAASAALATVSAGILVWLAVVNLRLLRRVAAGEARFVSIVDAVQHGVLEIDEHGTIVYTNPACDAMLGWPRGELIGQVAAEALSPDGADGAGSDADAGRPPWAMSSGQPHHGLEQLRRRDGETFPAEVSSAPVAANGRAVGNVILLQDVSERLRRDLMREDMLSYASHELRSPLAVIEGFAKWLNQRATRGQLGNDEASVEAIDAISASSSRLVRTLDTFLDIARLGSASLHVEQAPFDLVETIEEELTAVRMRYPEAVVRTSCPPGPIEVCSDELRVRQVLVNLLDNAAKYGGEPPIIDVVAERDDEHASVHVRDNGPGVAPEDQAHLFERFYRGSRQPTKGLGVGLFLSRQIVQQLGGTLTFRNLPGGGAEFTLLLPIVKKRT